MMNLHRFRCVGRERERGEKVDGSLPGTTSHYTSNTGSLWSPPASFALLEHLKHATFSSNSDRVSIATRNAQANSIQKGLVSFHKPGQMPVPGTILQ